MNSTALPLLFGVVSFLIFAASDFCSVLSIKRIPFVLFALGGVMLTSASGVLLFQDGMLAAGKQMQPLRLLAFLFAGFFLVFLLYTLFFALPFGASYLEGGPELVDRGVYALCRHPGVLWLFAFYFCCWLGSGKRGVLYACLLFSLCDLLYVLLQDRVIFPRTIPGYLFYQKSTPFLIPTKNSIRSFLFRSHE